MMDRKRIKCQECGQMVMPWTLRVHTQSTRHRFDPTIRHMLTDPSYTLADIARVCNVSREMVRLIAKDMGYGRERLEVRKKQRVEKFVQDGLQHFESLLPDHVIRDFKVTPIVNHHNQVASTRLVEINGHLCAVRRAVYSPYLAKKFGKNWVRIRPIAQGEGVEFVLYELPERFPASPAWLIVPIAEVPKREAHINLAKESDRPNFLGRWWRMLNAWQLLRPAA